MITLLLGLLLTLGDPPTQADEAYRAGRYEEAIRLFTEALAEPGAHQGPILYNLGNCAFRLGRQFEALYHYRRAQLRMPRDPEVRFNLQFTERQLGITAPARSWTDWFTAAELLALAAGLQILGLVGIFRLRRRMAQILAGVLVLLGIFASSEFLRTQWFSGPPAGVVLAEILLRPEPHNELPPTLRLDAGETVRVQELSERWIRVTHPLGEGWAARESVGVIN